MHEIDYSKKPHLNKKNVIYKITNKINNMAYVGQTKQTASRRWKSHRKDARRLLKGEESGLSLYLYRAMLKYGVENFTVEVVEQCEKHLLSERERFWIKEFNCLAPNGYNLTTGGESCEFSEITLKKMSETRKGKRLNVDYSKLRKFNSRPMKFIKDGQEYIPDVPADFMKEHGLDRSQCHKVAKGRPLRTYGRNGKAYPTIPKTTKGWKVEYIETEERFYEDYD